MKKNCLLILPRDIFPVIGGYALKNEALIKGLSKQYNLYLVVVSNRQLSETEELFYQQHSKEFHYFSFSKWRYLFNAALSLFTKKPIQTNYFYFSKVQKCINEILPHIDIAIGALVRTMKYLENTPQNVFKLFDMVDSFGLIYKKSVDEVQSNLWKAIYKVESKRLLKYERECIYSSNLTYLFSETEKDYWKQYSEKVQWVPYGIKDFLATYDKKDEQYRDAVAFIGKMDYRPNIDAVKWYAENIHSKLPNPPKFIIIGAYPTEEVKKLQDKYNNIVVTGFVEDPYVILNSVKAVVAPMQTGGGIQTKVLEAMVLGKTVILSKLAAGPIHGTEDGKHFLVADTLEEYEKAFCLINNADECSRIGKNAKDLVKSTFSWNNYLKHYISYIEEALSAN